MVLVHDLNKLILWTLKNQANKNLFPKINSYISCDLMRENTLVIFK